MEGEPIKAVLCQHDTCPGNARSARRAGRSILSHTQKVTGEVQCFTRGQKGCIAMRCPATALFGKGQQQVSEHPRKVVGGYCGMEVCWKGLVVEKRVADILLDTGCSRTLVRTKYFHSNGFFT